PKHFNLLLVIPDIEHCLEKDEIEKLAVAPELGNISGPYYPIVSRPRRVQSSDDFVLKLIDFGSEVILDAGWGAPADIWNYACLIYELYSRKTLFGGIGHLEIPPEAIQLAQMQSICGPFPEDFLQRGKLSSDYFDLESGQVGRLTISPMPLRGFLENWIPTLHGAPKAEIDQFESFLKIMLQLEPGSRPSVSEMLRHP
ncbi:hypothetical protein FRC05_004868, partial [Tulasnella sp. 425]